MLKLYYGIFEVASFDIKTFDEAGEFSLNFEEKTNDAYVDRLWIYENDEGKWIPTGWEGGIAWEKTE